jgi:hypothetical protein
MLLSVRFGSTAAAAEEEDALILFARTTIEVAGRCKARKRGGEVRKRAARVAHETDARRGDGPEGAGGEEGGRDT